MTFTDASLETAGFLEFNNGYLRIAAKYVGADAWFNLTDSRVGIHYVSGCPDIIGHNTVQFVMEDDA